MSTLRGTRSTSGVSLLIRELTTVSELAGYFSLRRKVYADSGYLPSGTGLDIDDYDWRSRFLGAFLVRGEQLEMVGGARLITEGLTPLSHLMEELADRPGAMPTNFFSEKVFDFRPYLEPKLYPGQETVEFGRTVCLAEHRGLGIGKFMIFALYGLALNLGASCGIGCAPPHLLGFYTQLGCVVLDPQGCRHGDLTVQAIPLLVDFTRTRQVANLGHEAARRLRAGEGLWLCDHPDCLSEHDHSGRLPTCEFEPDLGPEEVPYDWTPAQLTLALLSRSVALHDATLTEGVRSPSALQPDVVGRMRILESLDRLGVRSASLGQPGHSPRRASETLRLLESIREQGMKLRPALRFDPGIDRLEPILTLARRTGDRFEVQLTLAPGIDPSDPELECAVQASIEAGLEVTLVVEDAMHLGPEALPGVLELPGVARVCLSDSTGWGTPDGVRALIRRVRAHKAPDLGLDWAGRADRGLAVPNALAAFEAGAERVFTSAVGLGERCGLAPTELMLLHLARRCGRPVPREALEECLQVVARELGVTATPAWLRQSREVA